MTRLRAYLDTSLDAVFSVSLQGEVLYASPSSVQVLGYLPGELVGRNMFDLVHREDRVQLGQAFEDVVARTVSPIRSEARVCRKDWQWLLIECTMSNFLDEPGLAPVIVNVREFPEKTAPTKREGPPIGEVPGPTTDFHELASSLAHDLKEPLNTISMFADLLIRDLRDGADRQTVSFLTQAVARALRLVDGVYSLAVPGLHDAPGPVHLRGVVEDALQNLAAAIDASGAIVTVDALPDVQGNRSNLVRVFQNLIANAITYRSDAPIRIHLSAESVGPDWVVKVKDNGIGIAHAHHHEVFGLLTRLHGQSIPGSGIGLALCKKIVEASGGAIWIESDGRTGSTFCFTIPALVGQSANAALPLSPPCVCATAARAEDLGFKTGARRSEYPEPRTGLAKKQGMAVGQRTHAKIEE